MMTDRCRGCRRRPGDVTFPHRTGPLATLLLTLSTAAISAPAPARAVDWVPRPIPDLAGPVDRLVIPHPTDPDVVLVVDSVGDAHRTADGGATWNRVATEVERLAFAPSDPSRVYAFREADGDSPLRVSRDGGMTFSEAPFPQTEFRGRAPGGSHFQHLFFRALAVDPFDADTVYVANLFETHTDFFFFPSEHLWKSTDGGETWSELLEDDDRTRSLAVDPGDPAVIYRGTERGLAVSRDGGGTFDPPVTFPPLAFIEHIALDPFRDDTLWLAGEATVVRSEDGGRTGVTADRGLPSGEILSLVADRTHAGVVYALVAGAGPQVSLDRGVSWRPARGALAPGRFLGPLAAGPEGLLWAGAPGGVLRSEGERPCGPAETALCLQDNRFRVGVSWTDFQGGAGEGTARPLTADTGAFWFFDADNLELMVKVLDGRPVNGHFWVFLAGLSNVGYTVTVTDTATGAVWTRENPPFTFSSLGDTRAFAADASAIVAEGSSLPAAGERFRDGAPGPLVARPGATEAAMSPPGAAAGWRPRGTKGGAVEAVAVSPADPDHVWAGTLQAGIFRSDDGGASWQESPTSPVLGPVRHLGLSFVQPGEVWALMDGELLHSRDDGRTWREVTVREEDPDLSLTALAVRGSLILVGSQDGSIFRGRNQGLSWDPVHEAGQAIELLAMAPERPSLVWALTRGSLLHSDDTGLTWRPVLDSFESLAEPPQKVLRAGAGSSPTLWAAGRRGVVRSLDGGKTWTRVGALAAPVTDLAVLPALGLGGTVWAATGGDDGGVHESTDGGDTWRRVGTGLEGSPRALAVTPAAPDRILTGTTESLFVLDRDGGGDGQRWRPVSTGLTARPTWDVAVGSGDPDRVFAVEDGTLFRTADGGDTWQPLVDAVRVAVHPTEPERVWVLRERVADQVLRSDDGGTSFEPVPLPMEGELFGEQVVTHPTDPDTLWVLSQDPTPGGAETLDRPTRRIWRTLDGGHTWRDVWNRPDDLVLSLAVDPFDPEILYAAGDTGVERSFDGGGSWEPTGFPAADPGADRIAADPLREGRIWAWSRRPARLYRSDDRGGSWTEVGRGLPREGPVELGDLVADPTVPDKVFALFPGRGPFVSGDGGASWMSIAGDLEPSRFFTDLAAHPVRPEVLWAGTLAGVHRLEGAPTCRPGDTTLCLHQGRFRVEVLWEDFQGGRGGGHAQPFTADTGTFWFFQPDNLELMVKVLDARPVNGHFWVFYGSLSNVAFTLQVLDTATGRLWVRENPAGTFASAGDTTAFPAGFEDRPP